MSVFKGQDLFAKAVLDNGAFDFLPDPLSLKGMTWF
jgi:hypothetical protein